jgi:hypothetical protein
LSFSGLAFLEHAERDAGLHAERLDLAHHVEHAVEIVVLRPLPRGAHAEARGALGLGRLGGGDDFVERHQALALGIGVVARRLRAVAAILGATAGLDREQRRALNGVGIEMLAVHALGAPDQIHQRHFVEGEHFLDRPAAGRERLGGGRNGGERAGVHGRPCLRKIGRNRWRRC